MKRTSLSIAVPLSATLLITSCATLSGTPQSLTMEQSAALNKGDLATALKTADDLFWTYSKAADDLGVTGLWTSAAYVPLAAIAAWAVYAKASTDVLAATGLLAGGVAGTGQIINAKANRSIYVKAFTSIRCVQSALVPFNTAEKRNELSSLQSNLDELNRSLTQTNLSIENASKVNFSSREAEAEISKDPQSVVRMAAAQSKAAQTTTDASKSADSARSEINGFASIGYFAATSVQKIDLYVRSNVASGETDYKSMEQLISTDISQFSSSSKQTPAAGTPNVGHAAANIPAAAPAVVSKTPLKDVENALTRDNAKLSADVSILDAAEKKTGVVAAQTTVAACLKF